MCGICFICSLDSSSSKQLCPLLDLSCIRSNSSISRRGPDIDSVASRALWSGIPSTFAGFVLHLRGQLTPQPLTNDDGDLLLWNGEIFGGIEIGADANDTQVLFERLVNCSDALSILSTIKSIQGPWALIFWQSKHERLWFGRDVFGRRSLLWHLPDSQDGIFALSSVPVKLLEYAEIPSVGMFCLEASQRTGVGSAETGTTHAPPCPNNCASPDNPDNAHTCVPLSLHLYPWQGVTWPGTGERLSADADHTVAHKLGLDDNRYIRVKVSRDATIPSWMPVLNVETPSEEDLLSSVCAAGEADVAGALHEISQTGQLDSLVLQLIDMLQKAVDKRVTNLPRPDVSEHYTRPKISAAGVADSFEHMTLNVQKDDGELCRNLSPDVEGASFSNSTGGKNQSSVQDGHASERCSGPPVSASAIHSSRSASGEGCGGGQSVVTILCDPKQKPSPSALPAVPGSSGDLNPKPRGMRANACQPYVAVLFSGGIDSTVLAALADRCVPENESIDLINVAFEQKKKSNVQHGKKRKGDSAACGAAEETSHYNVPDRLTGYSALAELNPHRCWNFVEVNVTQEMLQEHRDRHVRGLVYPLRTVLDDSIGCAVWFAARGQGVLGNGPDQGDAYTSTARVILVGMGADEQLAGYSRHRVRFQQGSWSALNQEINMEMHRISARNLGRDDRIIADHGKESRIPFLDEDVVAFLAALPIHHKADLRLPRGAGEKLLLRLAALRLGLSGTAALPKRAIQFGSRIAKLGQSKEKGSQVCRRLADE